MQCDTLDNNTGNKNKNNYHNNDTGNNNTIGKPYCNGLWQLIQYNALHKIQQNTKYLTLNTF